MKLLIHYLPCIVSIICAYFLLKHGVSGWGWFLSIGLLVKPCKSK